MFLDCRVAEQSLGKTFQGVIANAKANYKKITFAKAHETHETLADFLKDYDILQAVKNFASAWSQVTKRNMRAVWNPLLQRDETYPLFLV